MPNAAPRRPAPGSKPWTRPPGTGGPRAPRGQLLGEGRPGGGAHLGEPHLRGGIDELVLVRAELGERPLRAARDPPPAVGGHAEGVLHLEAGRLRVDGEEGDHLDGGVRVGRVGVDDRHEPVDVLDAAEHPDQVAGEGVEPFGVRGARQVEPHRGPAALAGEGDEHEALGGPEADEARHEVQECGGAVDLDDAGVHDRQRRRAGRPPEGPVARPVGAIEPDAPLGRDGCGVSPRW